MDAEPDYEFFETIWVIQQDAERNEDWEELLEDHDSLDKAKKKLEKLRKVPNGGDFRIVRKETYRTEYILDDE